jgi:hypothetical protein
VAVVAALLAVLGTVDLMAIAVTDTTGWTAWNTSGTTTAMTDITTPADSGISNSAADFTGGIYQKAGLLGSDQSVMWQVETNEPGGSEKFAGVIGLGVGLTDNPNEINFVMLLSASNQNQQVQFASMTGLGGVANSPSELTWGTVGNSAGDAGSSNNLTSSTYNKSSGVITFALSYATLQQAIQSYAGAAFSSFVVDDLTHLNFVAFTDSSVDSGGVPIDGDLFGAASTATTRSSTASFTSQGMGTTLIRPGGGPIPEPAAIYQLGGFIGVVLLGFFWRRRRAAKQSVSAPRCT